MGWRHADVGGWWRSRADAVEDGPGRLPKLKNRHSCARMGRPRLGRDSSEHHDGEKQGRVRGMAHTYGTACLQNWRSNQPITWGEHVHERTAQKESKGGRQVGFLSHTFRRLRAPERGVMQTQVVSEFFRLAIGFAASAHVLMTRYPAFGKQTNGPFCCCSSTPGLCCTSAGGVGGGMHAPSQRRAKR